ncbi:hypothetical protein ACWS7L_02255 [Exiguobacterium artemiae]
MRKYHRIFISGREFFREYDEALDCYKGELLTEEDVIEQVLEDVVQDIIHVDRSRVQRAVKNVSWSFLSEMVFFICPVLGLGVVSCASVVVCHS